MSEHPRAELAPPLLFWTPSYAPLAHAIVDGGGLEAGTLETKVFPDGEHYRRLATPVAGRRVVLLAGTIDEVDSL
ncbi:MAG: hypothetical protein AAGF23_19285, partial [Acidobacteriota bacterium]